MEGTNGGFDRVTFLAGIHGPGFLSPKIELIEESFSVQHSGAPADGENDGPNTPPTFPEATAPAAGTTTPLSEAEAQGEDAHRLENPGLKIGAQNFVPPVPSSKAVAAPKPVFHQAAVTVFPNVPTNTHSEAEEPAPSPESAPLPESAPSQKPAPSPGSEHEPLVAPSSGTTAKVPEGGDHDEAGVRPGEPKDQSSHSEKAEIFPEKAPNVQQASVFPSTKGDSTQLSGQSPGKEVLSDGTNKIAAQSSPGTGGNAEHLQVLNTPNAPSNPSEPTDEGDGTEINPSLSNTDSGGNDEHQPSAEVSNIEIEQLGPSKFLLQGTKTLEGPIATANAKIADSVPIATVSNLQISVAGASQLVVDRTQTVDFQSLANFQIHPTEISRPGMVVTISGVQISAAGQTEIVLNGQRTVDIPPLGNAEPFPTEPPSVGKVLTVSGIEISRLNPSQVVLDKEKTLALAEPEDTGSFSAEILSPGKALTISGVSFEEEGPNLVLDGTVTRPLPTQTRLITISNVEFSYMGSSLFRIDRTQQTTEPQATPSSLGDLAKQGAPLVTPGTGPARPEVTGALASAVAFDQAKNGSVSSVSVQMTIGNLYTTTRAVTDSTIEISPTAQASSTRRQRNQAVGKLRTITLKAIAAWFAWFASCAFS